MAANSSAVSWFGLISVALVVVGLSSSYAGGWLVTRRVRRRADEPEKAPPGDQYEIGVLIMGGLATAILGGLLLLVWLVLWLA